MTQLPITRPVEPFRAAVPDAQLDDLRQRLAATRFPREVVGGGWSQGVDMSWLRSIIEYWRTDYDWRRYETRINATNQYVLEVDGQRIHFFHAPSTESGALPLLLLHGYSHWAGEYLDVLGPLCHPPAGGPARRAFHVVAPNLPGFAFSGPTSQPGWGPRRMADAFVAMMSALGYERFGVQGHDMGSAVAMNLADAYPDRVVGLHLNYSPDMRSKRDYLSLRLPEWITWESLTPVEREAMAYDRAWRKTLMEFHELKAKEPQNIGVLQDDAPVALLIGIHSSDWGWRTWEAENRHGKDGVLDPLTVQWVCGTATSSLRSYYELNSRIRDNIPQSYIGVPTGIAVFPKEQHTPRRWVEHRYNVVYWSTPARGGHFAALDAPDLFTEDLRRFFEMVR
jgi:pimeloyl-ACP methyl ester carboxylesterase